MLTTQSGKFKKFEFEFLAGIWSNTWQAKIQKIGGTVGITVLPRSKPVAMLEDVSAVEPSSLCLDPSRVTWEETEDTARTLSPLLLPLCKLPTDVTSPAPTHSTPQPRQHPSSTPPRPPCPAWPLHTARAPAPATFWPPLPSASRAYKNPPVDPQKKHTFTATDPHSSLFLSPSESSNLCEHAPPRSWRLRPPLELLLVRGGAAEPPPSICYPAIKLCFLSVEPTPSNTRLCTPVSFPP
jgi:hypothetical protein